jgi:sugar/nucleoside kinase (ribokinase family)
MRAIEDRLVFIANAPKEMEAIPIGERVGPKQPVRFENRLGGVAGNAALVATVNRIQTHLVAVQARDEAEPCRQLARKSGLTPHITERDDEDAAISVSYPYPNGHVGVRALLVQRCRPITLDELMPHRALLGRARALVVGPLPIESDRDGAGTLNLLKRLPGLAPRAHCALEPHLSLIRDPCFPEVASLYRYVQMNADESHNLPVAGSLPDRIAYLRDVLGDEIDIAITNAGHRGLTWSDGREWPITPIAVSVVSDVGAGDAFCTAWVIARAFFGAEAAAALDYALRAVAASISRSGTLAPFLAPAVIG